MTRFTVAVIGTGPEPDNIVWGESAAMAYRHGEAYEGLSQCDLVGCADIVRENAEAFADEFEIGEGDVDMQACADAAREADVEWLIYEHDMPDDPAASIETGAAFLESL